MKQQCWFCGEKNNLLPHERDYDSAPYVDENGEPQMICVDCVIDIRDYRRRSDEQMAHMRRMLRGELNDRDYARQAWEQQKRDDAAEGFEG
jgi:hypothetical protein